jgi:tetratricopeptide (TPR) repeat protein
MLKPRYAETYYALGYARIAKHEFDEAIADFDQAIRFDGTMAWAYQGRGTALMNKRELVQAIADFGRALELDSQIAEAYMNRGLTRLLQDKDTEAQSDFEKYLALKPAGRSELDQRIETARALRSRKP